MMMIPIIANVMMVMLTSRWRAAPCPGEKSFYDDDDDDDDYDDMYT